MYNGVTWEGSYDFPVKNFPFNPETLHVIRTVLGVDHSMSKPKLRSRKTVVLGTMKVKTRHYEEPCLIRQSQ